LRILTLAVVFAFTACASSAQVAAPNARCYRLAFGAWTRPLEGDLYHPLPTSVRLRADVAMAREGDTLRRGDRTPVDSLRRVALWRMENDSLMILFPSWWSTGVRVRVPLNGRTPHGRAEVYVDFTPYEPPTAQVSAAHMDCAEFGKP
jgi:hypothetical protein